MSEDDPAHDDFELWSPSEGRTEACLFGRQVRSHLSYSSATMNIYYRHFTSGANATPTVLLARKPKQCTRSSTIVPVEQTILSGKSLGFTPDTIA